MNCMNRRRFLRTASTTLLLPLHAAFAASQAGNPDTDFFFYDERFAAAGNLAMALSGGCETVPVQSDMTDIWRAGLKRAALQGHLVLRGVTTESFHFCLRTMLADGARVESQISRVDRDLHLWTIRSETTNNKGVNV